MSDFVFNKRNHSYTLDGRRMTGCTTVLGIIAKPALIQWSSDLGAIAGIESPQVVGITEEYEAVQTIIDRKEKAIAKRAFIKKYPSYGKARLAHMRKKKGAADIGTMAHEMIELWISDSKELASGYDKITAEEKSMVDKMVLNFKNWAVFNKVKFIDSERKIYSRTHWVAGTADFTCLIGSQGDKKFVGDIKTSTGIYDRTPLAQAAGYRMMLEEMGEKDFGGSVIVNIKKTGEFDSVEDVYWSTDYKEDLSLFMGALQVYRVLNNCVMK